MTSQKSKSLFSLLLTLTFCFQVHADEKNEHFVGEIIEPGWINIRQTSEDKSKVIGKLKTGSTFAVQQVGEKYLLLDGQFAGGYILGKFVKVSGERFPVEKMAGTEVWVRGYPSQNGRLLGSLKLNEIITVAKDGDWYQIKTGPYAGKYIYGNFVKPLNYTGPVLKPDLNAGGEAIPVAAGEVITTSTGEKIDSTSMTVEELPKPMAELAAANNTPENVTNSVNAAATAEVAAAKPNASGLAQGAGFERGQVTGEDIRVRSAPSKNGKVAGLLKKGEELEVEKKGDWYEIKSGNFAGKFVSAQFIAPIATDGQTSSAGAIANSADASVTNGAQATAVGDAAALAQSASALSAASASVPTATISAGTVRVRQAPGASGAVVGALKKGETVEVEKKGDWYEIKSGPLKGNYISAQFAKENPVANSANAAGADIAAGTAANTGEAANSATSATSSNDVSVGSPSKKIVAAQAPPPKNWDEKTEARFQDQVAKAFKKRASRANDDLPIMVPVFYASGKVNMGLVRAKIKTPQDVEVERVAFFKILRKLLVESFFDNPILKLEDPEKNKDLNEWVRMAAFHHDAIIIKYDELKVEVTITVPPEFRSVGEASLTRGQFEFDVEVEPPAKFSTYLNINATDTIDSREQIYSDRRTPLRAQLESGTRVGGFVIEATGNYTEKRSASESFLSPKAQAFIREDLRVVRDFPSLSSRVAIGDLNYPTQGYQTFRQMQGASIYSQFSMNPSKTTFPSGSYEVFLKTNSKVYIWVNEQMLQMLELPAGRHQLKDFPYTNGLNNIKLEIVDDFGQSETITYSYFSSSELLRTGLHQFNYAYGNPAFANKDTREKEYETGNGTISAFHRYGWSDRLTLGANVQNDSTQSIAGVESLLSTRYGFFKIEPAYSTAEPVGAGYAINTKYSYSDKIGKMKMQRLFNAGIGFVSKNFATLGNVPTAGVKRAVDLTFSHTRGISKMMSAFITSNYRVNREVAPDISNSYTLNLGINQRWRNGISLNTAASHSRTERGKDDLGINAFLIWSFPEDRQTVTAMSNSKSNSSRVDWNYSPGNGSDTASYAANIRRDDNQKGYGAQTNINGNRARVSASHEVIQERDPNSGEDEEKASNVTTLQLGTALMFAGGRFGIGRPVVDSFVIFSPVKSLSGETLLVNPDKNETYLSKSSWLGPAVVAELSSYNLASYKLGGKDLPIGISIPKDHFNFNPAYKSGYGIKVGTDANVYLVAVVQTPDGNSIGMIAGQAFYLGEDAGDDNEPVTFFTSRKGVIRSEGFRAGRYKLIIDPDEYDPVNIEIPDSVKNEYDLGVIKLQRKKK